MSITGSLPPGLAASLDLHSGQPALAADVLAARDRLLTALREASYALATVVVAPAVPTDAIVAVS